MAAVSAFGVSSSSGASAGGWHDAAGGSKFIDSSASSQFAAADAIQLQDAAYNSPLHAAAGISRRRRHCIQSCSSSRCCGCNSQLLVRGRPASGSNIAAAVASSGESRFNYAAHSRRDCSRRSSLDNPAVASTTAGDSKFKSRVERRREWSAICCSSFNPPAATHAASAHDEFRALITNSYPAAASSESNCKNQMSNTKGWTDENGVEDSRLVAQLRNIALAAEDRKEMHAIIGVQRDNWNKLCHITVNMTTIAAAILAAMNTGGVPGMISSTSGSSSFSMSVAAFLLNSGAAGFMFLASKYQPSQLAEEQRTAARFHKLLARDIHNTLLIDARLRKNAQLYMKEVMVKLESLEVAFPLPLKPNGLQKFPEIVTPSILGPEADLSKTEIPAMKGTMNGWTETCEEDLKQTAEKLKSADIQIYLQQARNKELANKTLAILAPILAATAALLSLLTACCCFYQLPAASSTTLGSSAGMILMSLVSLLPPAAAAINLISCTCSIAALWCSSFSNGGQIGMIFELYRNCAGYYEEMEQEIQTTIRLPISHREHGELFHQKIALQLGRHDCFPLFNPSQERKAGKLF